MDFFRHTTSCYIGTFTPTWTSCQIRLNEACKLQVFWLLSNVCMPLLQTITERFNVLFKMFIAFNENKHLLMRDRWGWFTWVIPERRRRRRKRKWNLQQGLFFPSIHPSIHSDMNWCFALSRIGVWSVTLVWSEGSETRVDEEDSTVRFPGLTGSFFLESSLLSDSSGSHRGAISAA